MQVIEKPWGKEEILEQNKDYMVKRLTMNEGYRCSLQYHSQKTETIYLLSGKLKIYFGTTPPRFTKVYSHVILNPHDTFTLTPYTIHRMEAMEESTYLEASTPENTDTIRFEDDYGRV